MKVLILDDDHDIVDVITYVLEDAGYETRSLYSGEKLMETIAAFAPDLVLMDVMLGDQDGRVLCRQIKDTMTKPPVILISASHDLRESLLQKGAPDDFIAKPFDIDKLLAKVKSYTFGG